MNEITEDMKRELAAYVFEMSRGHDVGKCYHCAIGETCQIQRSMKLAIRMMVTR